MLSVAPLGPCHSNIKVHPSCLPPCFCGNVLTTPAIMAGSKKDMPSCDGFLLRLTRRGVPHGRGGADGGREEHAPQPCHARPLQRHCRRRVMCQMKLPTWPKYYDEAYKCSGSLKCRLACAAGDYPEWTFFVQVMPMDTDPATLGFDPLDDTKVWCICPISTIGPAPALPEKWCCFAVKLSQEVGVHPYACLREACIPLPASHGKRPNPLG